MGSVVAIILGIVWTANVSSMGAHSIYVLFGIMFIGMGIIKFIYNYKNATGQKRMSLYDITDEQEESDPYEKYSYKKNET